MKKSLFARIYWTSSSALAKSEGMRRKQLSDPQVALCRPHWWAILCSMKTSMGRGVKELSEELGMSYMGVRQHIDSMLKEELIEIGRRAVKVGRPQKLYRLSERGQSLFAGREAETVAKFLEEAAILFDQMAPEKLLMVYFERMQREMSKQVRGKNMLEKMEALAKERSKLGYWAVCRFDNELGLRLEEYHHPLEFLLKRYTNLISHEQECLELVLGTALRRVETTVGTHQQVSWVAPTV